MKPDLIFDFDGTLFNTLPIFFRIKKHKLVTPSEIFECHRSYTEVNKCNLEKYACVWKAFFASMQKDYDLILISETAEQILKYYLNFFELNDFFKVILGEELSASGKRQKTLSKILEKKNKLQNIFVSDNKEDAVLNFQNLTVYPANQFFTGDISHFEKEILQLSSNIRACYDTKVLGSLLEI